MIFTVNQEHGFMALYVYYVKLALIFFHNLFKVIVKIFAFCNLQNQKDRFSIEIVEIQNVSQNNSLNIDI